METLTTRQAAERIGSRLGRRVPVSTLHRWIADLRLRPLTKLDGLRGAYLFAASEVDAFAEALVEDEAAA